MIGRHSSTKNKPRGNAVIEAERLTVARMKSTGRRVFTETLKAVLAADPDLAERYAAETNKGRMPR